MIITYFVNNQPQQSDQSALPQREILAKAGYGAEEYYLIDGSGTEYRAPDAQVPVKDGEKFEVKPLRKTPPHEVIHYEVNGLRQTTETSPLPLQNILERAGRDAGIGSDDLGRYRLENSATGDKYTNLADPVPIHDGDKFVAIYVGATPVA